MFDLDISGAKALERALSELPKKFATKSVRTATRDTQKEITLRDAKRTAPVGETGKLKRSLKVRTAKNRNGKRLPRGVIGHAVVSAKTKTVDAYYARWVFLNREGHEGTRTLRKSLYGNKAAIRATLTGKLRVDLPRITREVYLDSLRYKG